MKKTIAFMLTLTLMFISVQTVLAESTFSLKNGVIAENESPSKYLSKLFAEMLIASANGPDKDKYVISGTGSGESTRPAGNHNYQYIYSCEIVGEFDARTGGFYGTFTYKETFEAIDAPQIILNYAAMYDMQGEFTGISGPGDKSVVLTFQGTNNPPVPSNTKDITFPSSTKDYTFNITFDIEGSLPFAQESPEQTAEPEATDEPEETDGPEEPEDTEESPAPPPAAQESNDSGARFGDISGQVEILRPTGYDSRGEPIYDEEAWDVAKPGNVLPKGVRIKTGEDSSATVSFSDMTTFVMKPESEIYLEGTKEQSKWDLIVGKIWVNVKRMVKDGTMEVHGSQAVAGIKGTTFVLEEDGNTSTLKVIEGRVEYTAKATGESVTVGGGQTVSATKDGLGDIKEFNEDEEASGWEEQGGALPPAGFPRWAILAIGAGALLVLLIAVIAIASHRKKRLAAAMHPAPGQDAQNIPTTFCTQCGKPLNAGALFCTKCGMRTELGRR